MNNSISKMQNSVRFEFLDFIRALACLPVLVTHLNPALLPGGGMGVGLFFALSGFLIARIAAKEVRDFTSASKFVIRRIFRVFPLFVADLSILAIAYYFFYPQMWPGFVAAFPGLITMQAMPTSFLGIGVGVLWTLQVEFAFYLVTPLFILLFKAQKGLLILSLILVLSSSGILQMIFDGLNWFSKSRVEASSFLYWGGGLGMGVIAYLIWELKSIRGFFSKKTVLYSYGMFGMALVVIAWLLTIPAEPEALFHFEVLVASLAGVLLIFAWLINPKIYVLPGSAFIGRISFSIYLIHAVFSDFAHYANQTWGMPWLYLNPLIFAPVVIIFSYISYRLIEKPGIWLGKKITNFY